MSETRIPYVAVGVATYSLTEGHSRLAAARGWKEVIFRGHRVLWNSCVSPSFAGAEYDLALAPKQKSEAEAEVTKCRV